MGFLSRLRSLITRKPEQRLLQAERVELALLSQANEKLTYAIKQLVLTEGHYYAEKLATATMWSPVEDAVAEAEANLRDLKGYANKLQEAAAAVQHSIEQKRPGGALTEAEQNTMKTVRDLDTRIDVMLKNILDFQRMAKQLIEVLRMGTSPVTNKDSYSPRDFKEMQGMFYNADFQQGIGEMVICLQRARAYVQDYKIELQKFCNLESQLLRSQ